MIGSRTGPRLARGDDGFSLVEMMVVLAIIALAASVVGFNFRRAATADSLPAKADETIQLFGRARMRAIASGHAIEIALDVGSKSLAAPGEAPVAFDVTTGMTAIVGDRTVTGAQSAVLTFLPDGSSSGADLVLTGRDGKKLEIEVNWLTGLLSLRRIP